MIKPRLLRLAQLSRLLLAATVVQGGTVGLLTILQAWLLSRVISDVFLGGTSLAQVATQLNILLIAILGRALLAWSIEVTSSTLAQRVKTYFRQNILARILAAGPVAARQFNTSDLTGALSGSLDTLEPYYSQFLPQLFLAVIIPVSILITVAISDPLSALVLLLTGPLIPVFMYLIGKQAEHSTTRQWKLLNQMSAYFLDVIQGLTTLKLLGRSKQQVAQIAQVSERFRQVTIEVLRITFLSALVLELLSTLSTAVVAVQVGLRLLSGGMSFDNALFVLILAPEYYLPLRLLGLRFHAAMSGAAASEQVFGILDSLPPAPTADSNLITSHFSLTSSSPPRITFSSITFTYPGEEQPAVEDVSFDLSPGSVTALVGPSGAGKSTLASLLLGFLSPARGKVIAGNQALAEINPVEWRKHIAWLPQHPCLLNDSIANNLRLANPAASLDEIQKAAHLANAEEFIQSLPAGYDTQIGEGGVRLSAGQAQRLALARIFLRDAPLVILDEPAAHLDPAAEQVFLDALQALRGRCTILVIAHSPGSMAIADQVLVLAKGKLVQSGAPCDLSGQPGLYHDFLSAGNYLSQNSYQISDGSILNFQDLSPESSQPPNATFERASHTSTLTEQSAHTSPLAFLYRQLLPFWREVGLSVLLGFGVIASSFGLMATSAYLISAAALQPSIAELQVAIVGVRFFGLSRGVLRYLERLVSHDVTFRLLGRLRVWFYQVLEPLAPARLLYRQGGDLLSRITSDIATLETFYVRSAAPLFVAGFSFAGLLLFFAPFGPALTATLALVFLLAGLPLPWMLKRLGEPLGRQLVDARARMQSGLVGMLQGLPDLLVFGNPGLLQDRARSLAEKYAQLQQRLASLNGLQSALSILLSHLGMFLILVIGVQAVSSGGLQGVYLAMLVLAALASFEAVQPLALSAQQTGEHKQAASRLLELASEEPAIRSPLSMTYPDPAIPTDGIKIHRLGFTYPGETQPVLQNISFELHPGQQIAIVGPSGAGKTTLLHLLLRFWDYTCGDVLLYGSDLRSLAPEDVRQRLAVVSQNTYLFNASLEDNLRIANPSATATDLEEALKQALLNEFIQSLPEGLSTPLGEHGLRLSAGQRQRIAIARALLRPAAAGKLPVLLLDEPTTGLDALAGQAILEMLGQLRRTRSMLMITHHLAGLEDFDEIIVLSAGIVIERGTHAGLLAAGGWYAQNYQLRTWISSNR